MRRLAASTALFVAAVLVLATPARGRAAADATPSAPSAAVTPAGPEDAYQQQVDTSLHALQKDGFDAIAGDLPKLRDILAHAPATYPQIERRDRLVIVHADDDDEYLKLGVLAMATTTTGGAGRGVSVRRGPNPYPMAAFLLASYANEKGQNLAALVYTDRGLAMQPGNFLLVAEKVAALTTLNRQGEAVAVLDAQLNSGAVYDVVDRARFLRPRGVALIDLGRLDEAEASLREALKDAPDDSYNVRRCNDELVYIGRLRAGGSTIQTRIMTRGNFEKATKQKQGEGREPTPK